eukprot:3254318-Pyramimonas_sp.AAC.1
MSGSPSDLGLSGAPGGHKDQVEALEEERKNIWRFEEVPKLNPEMLAGLTLEDPKPPLEPGQIRSVLGKFKKRTAAGACNWSPHALKQLCNS